MAQALCPQLQKTIHINSRQSLMKHLLEQNIQVASSCQGDGICGKCKMEVLPQSVLPPLSSLESKTLQKNGGIRDERLSCQLYLDQNVTLRTTYW